jgi:predicted Rossmann fold nucleotide-binding protein DprA/Smf involved in DNA uptake
LADGCFPVCGVDDILTALALRGVLLPGAAAGAAGSAGAVGSGPGSGAGRSAAPSCGADYTGPDRALFEALSSDPVSLDHLARVTGMDLPALCGGLERLARDGVARDVGGWWERT